MSSELVKRLIAANESSQQAVMGSDIFYKAAERIDHLEKKVDELDVHLIVKKLIGEVEPVGESQTDEKRYRNLELTCGLVESLVADIKEAAYWKDRHEHSMSKAGKYADRFLKSLSAEIKNSNED